MVSGIGRKRNGVLHESEFSREMKPIEFLYIPKEIYYKKLTHSIIEANKSISVV